MTDDELSARLSLARQATPPFGLARQQTVIWSVRRRLQPFRPKLSHWVLAAAAMFCVGIGLASAYVWSRPSPSLEAQSPPRGAGDERWQLRDGSRIVMETPATVIAKQLESEHEVLFELRQGAARFDVARRPERAFRVQAGALRVEVIGTQFRVERKGEATAVSVQRGRVRVVFPEGKRELGVGESFTYEPPSNANTESPGRSESAASASGEAHRTTAQPSAKPAVPAPLGAEALFSNADRARTEGRPLEAVQALSQLTERYPRDARAPLAAFTRGRLLLEALHRPADAARAFSEARAFSGGIGGLAEDALAREVDALSAAGNTSAAIERAELYRKRYPKGLRLQHVLRRAGLSTAP